MMVKTPTAGQRIKSSTGHSGEDNLSLLIASVVVVSQRKQDSH